MADEHQKHEAEKTTQETARALDDRGATDTLKSAVSDAPRHKEVSLKEQRIRAITRLYYSNPKLQTALLEFSQNREVVPRYFEGFGKRPDTIQYVSDIMGLVKKGATSFHGSEEIWNDPLGINSDMSAQELSSMRKSWDLLIDIDSPFLDCSKIAAQLVIALLESEGIKQYGLKFSGSKGFHIIVSGNAFPREFDGMKMKESFPVWPRAICQYIMRSIRKQYNERVTSILPSLAIVEQRTRKTKEELLEAVCPDCGRPSIKKMSAKYQCQDCNALIERPEIKNAKQTLKCISCPGTLQLVECTDYFFCEYCKTSSFDKSGGEHSGKVTYTKQARENSKSFSGFEEQVSGEVLGGLDLVLVAPRHLFRMPYSLHEKTALASVVLGKRDLETFTPQEANPLTLQLKPFMPLNYEGEGARLLSGALSWKKEHELEEEGMGKKNYSDKKFEPVELSGVTEAMFPPAIKKLLQGLPEGKKRGLFILITFLRSCGFAPSDIAEKVYVWNTKNEPPLKEGYIRTQLDWHFRQKKKILPPNYDNEAFYKDLGLISGKQNVKNPLVEVMRALRSG